MKRCEPVLDSAIYSPSQEFWPILRTVPECSLKTATHLAEKTSLCSSWADFTLIQTPFNRPGFLAISHQSLNLAVTASNPP